VATLVNAGHIRSLVTGKAHYKLINDIDLSNYGSSFNNGQGWTPIGTGREFRGDFDGNNKKITGLYINTTVAYTGLFGVIVDTAKIYNLGVENVNITSSVSMTGGVAGYIFHHSSIDNCYTTGTITAAGNNAGGISGYVTNNSKVTNSYSTATIRANAFVGGIAAYVGSNSEVTGSYSTGSVSGASAGAGPANDAGSYVGGVVGFLSTNSKVTNSYALGEVKGNVYVGGVVGYVQQGGSEVSNTYSTGEVSGTTLVGGIVGGFAPNDASSVVRYNAALNPKVIAMNIANRIVSYDNGVYSGNRAFDGLLNTNNTTSWANKTHNGKDGADMTAANAGAASFWTTASNWQGTAWSTNTWITADGKLPVLRNTGGTQTGNLPQHMGGTEKPTNAPNITTNSLPNGTQNTAYSQEVLATGDTVIIWALLSGTPPDGVNIYADGKFEGRPSKAGTFTFTILAINHIGRDTRTFTVTIAADPTSSLNPIQAPDNSLQARMDGNKLHVSGLTVGQRWTIYNVLGTLVHQDMADNTTAEITLPIRGTYVIQSGNRTVKVVY
jgi:hypothetical protein